MYLGLVPRKGILNSLANSSFLLLPNNLIYFCSFKPYRVSHWLIKIEILKLISKSFVLKELNKNNPHQPSTTKTTAYYKNEYTTILEWILVRFHRFCIDLIHAY